METTLYVQTMAEVKGRSLIHRSNKAYAKSMMPSFFSTTALPEASLHPFFVHTKKLKPTESFQFA